MLKHCQAEEPRAALFLLHTAAAAAAAGVAKQRREEVCCKGAGEPPLSLLEQARGEGCGFAREKTQAAAKPFDVSAAKLYCAPQ